MRLLSWLPRDRRQAQSGATLVELLVSVAIMGLALVLIVGTFSTGVLDAVLAKRNTAATAVTQYEMEKVSASVFNPSAPYYSECFATESLTDPAPAPCPGGQYTLSADVTWLWLPPSTTVKANTVQVWTIAIRSFPSGSMVGTPVALYKATHQ
jgi:type II secretory pathway pseudopilin PulG